MKKIYGIDLGTTNSIIGHDNEFLSNLVPSIAKLEEKEAGEKYREDYNTSRSFKINISLGIEGKESIAASALVLKELVSKVQDKVEKVVISVPAYFSDNQRQATVKAANLIGLEVVALVNEPTAAAMYYNRNIKNLTLVYDLGGGTFDVSVVDSRFGNFDVQATDGLVLGGDNLDDTILRYVLKQSAFKPHLLKRDKLIRVRKELKSICEKAKVFIQKTRQDHVIDLTKYSDYCGEKYVLLPVDTYKEFVKSVFGPTIEKTKQVMSEAITYGEVFTFLLVGGSTRDPYLQEWLEEELMKKPAPITYDPDRIVAQGACLYASLIETGEAEVMVSDVTKALSVGLHDGTVRVIIQKNSKLPISDSIMVTNPVKSDGLELKLYQGDSILALNNEYIGSLEYSFSSEKEANTANVKISVSVNSNGIIQLKAKELLKPEVSVILNRETKESAK